MNTCKTCKWHKAENRDPRQAEGGAFCRCPKIYEETCGPDGADEYAADHCVYSYSEGGSFWTGDNFGCVHHEAKPGEGAA
jgi:hypothetical protein